MSVDQKQTAFAALRNILEKTPISQPLPKSSEQKPSEEGPVDPPSTSNTGEKEVLPVKKKRGRPPKQLYPKPPNMQRVDGKIYYMPTRGRPPKDIITEEAVVIDQEELAQYSSCVAVEGLSDNEDQPDCFANEDNKQLSNRKKNEVENKASREVKSVRQSPRKPKPVKRGDEEIWYTVTLKDPDAVEDGDGHDEEKGEASQAEDEEDGSGNDPNNMGEMYH